jgi:hypothetical protein
MHYHSELPARVRQADPTELDRLARLYPNNARLQTLVAQEKRSRPDRPKPSHPFTPLARA